MYGNLEQSQTSGQSERFHFFFDNISQSTIIEFFGLGQYFVLTLSVYVHNDKLRKFSI